MFSRELSFTFLGFVRRVEIPNLSILTLQLLSYGDGKFINRAPSENSLFWHVLSLNLYTLESSGKEDLFYRLFIPWHSEIVSE